MSLWSDLNRDNRDNSIFTAGRQYAIHSSNNNNNNNNNFVLTRQDAVSNNNSVVTQDDVSNNSVFVPGQFVRQIGYNPFNNIDNIDNIGNIVSVISPEREHTLEVRNVKFSDFETLLNMYSGDNNNIIRLPEVEHLYDVAVWNIIDRNVNRNVYIDLINARISFYDERIVIIEAQIDTIREQQFDTMRDPSLYPNYEHMALVIRRLEHSMLNYGMQKIFLSHLVRKIRDFNPGKGGGWIKNKKINKRNKRNKSKFTRRRRYKSRRKTRRGRSRRRKRSRKVK